MAHRKRDSKGRFVKKSHARRSTKRRRVVRLRKHGAVLVNPRRRRRTARKRTYARVRRGTRAVILNPRRRSHRRRYRHNPASIKGFFSGSMLRTVGLTAGGFIGVPFLEGFISKYVPASMQGKAMSYVVKIASVFALSYAVGKLMGKEAGQKVAIGGGAYVAITAVKDFVPTLLPATATGTAGMGRYLSAQPLLGSYQRGYMGSAVTATTPRRLQPQASF